VSYGARQLWALAAATARELLWGLPGVACEVRRWRARAAAIADAALREDALDALARKRDNIDGAALLWILSPRRDRSLLRLLVGYEAMADFLDSVNERAAAAGVVNGRQLHRALVEALDPAAPNTDYYRHNPWREDCGYLCALVQVCRTNCAALPAYGELRKPALAAAELVGVQALNHEPDPHCREFVLQVWAMRHRPKDVDDIYWFEQTAAASAWLTVLALLAVAAKPGCDEHEGEAISSAYFWISLTAAMLDSYADRPDDHAGEGHSYIAYYPTDQFAIERLREIVRRATSEARGLRDGDRHAVITACMVAMYLSKDSALAPQARAATLSLVRAGGPLTRLLLPLLRVWRIVYALRSA
jgi:tetraprenyl-beta-curcumene synthase